MNTKNTMISCALIAGLAGAANAAITVDWYAAAAPNVWGSPSYGQFWLDAQESILTMGGADNGAFSNSFEVTGMQSYVTSFDSYNGVYQANEGGHRPSWIYYISNDDGSLMDNSLLNTSTKTYGYTWEGTENDIAFGGVTDLPFGTLTELGRLGVRADGTTSTDMNGEYVGFLAISGMAWWATNWTGTLGVDHQWIDGDYMVNDPDRFDKLAQLAAYTEQYQDSWNFRINFGGQEFIAPDINIVPAPSAAALLGLGGLLATRRRR